MPKVVNKSEGQVQVRGVGMPALVIAPKSSHEFKSLADFNAYKPEMDLFHFLSYDMSVAAAAPAPAAPAKVEAPKVEVKAEVKAEAPKAEPAKVEVKAEPKAEEKKAAVKAPDASKE